jgi:hypothetical protein
LHSSPRNRYQTNGFALFAHWGPTRVAILSHRTFLRSCYGDLTAPYAQRDVSDDDLLASHRSWLRKAEDAVTVGMRQVHGGRPPAFEAVLGYTDVVPAFAHGGPIKRPSRLLHNVPDDTYWRAAGLTLDYGRFRGL